MYSLRLWVFVVIVILLQSAYAKSPLTRTRSSAVFKKSDHTKDSLKRQSMFNLIHTTTVPEGNLQRALAAPSSMLLAALKQSSGVISMTVLFVLWYAFNAGFNVFNAYVKQDFAYPWTTAVLQLLVGLFYAVPLWFLGVRKMPKLSTQDIVRLLPVAGVNALGHVCTVIAMFEKGGGSFTHVIKASEPVVSVALNLAVNGIVPRPFTGLSLLPITYGVAYASTLGNLNVAAMSKELTTKAAKMAMTSNVAFALRSIFRKNLPGDFKERTQLDPVNDHAVVTLLSFLLLLPLALVFEGSGEMGSKLGALLLDKTFSMNLLICGMCFYLYNELQNVVLGSLGPVPTAVGNTLKRVAIFVALYFFTAGETFPWPKVLGCAIAIAGCFAFAVFDSLKV